MNMTDELLTVEISSPDKQIWHGTAESVSSENSAGVFDILPFHANFITIIEDKPIKIKTLDKTEEFKFANSILYVSLNKVLIYTL
ncbi:hypothetical protein A3J20_02600 [Candidatus Gottesmanbacteria bacterium RIFCSPLOWO2_02_FULL_42_29]|uniref:ATP synthase F1 complex delta/epsilon subunit N-terminal domain-containing protein n=2 Tax=Candidatus Gottesmaniibacteriota TaxID=1752720 RepID=A0A1F6BL42_9BACT|nr:MAG: hypothetical protein A2781_06555 [Candidatus Gottesmanbacteria bacterium RIFCSPHIGHO2_01_FULL_42_27]OGG22375.1 MAG: hypothetical protein A3E72_06385 [Candidatus Gottesmanbacteria bacterium RIFCSPHIGHO2_12_FULL_43_26]OGG34911.1 MAG: hypothetical protein A3G68_01045 [Candidatus Gottesmanbacteria bacterium RIFCSPLOWO2_12_FULL_42_10]OGG37257.1 MAG: hypothetical protein A2968_02435 [Candidatus Gottesmanbacteria bacterium RIFCSPLOWO2_01_FULL_42_22]OGG39472.1 MAG: hypothetical protein A3J20_02